MRVLVLSNLYPPIVLGGYELICEGVVEALRGAGHEVVVLTSAGDPVDGQEHVRRELTFYLRDGRLRQPHPLLRLRNERADHRALARADDWDVALVFHPLGLAKSLLAALHARGPVGYVLGDVWPAWDLLTDTWLGRLHPEGPPGTPEKGVRRLRHPSLAARAIAPLARRSGIPTEWPDLFRRGRWWSNSRWTIDSLVNGRRLPLGGPRVIHHGVQLELFPFRPGGEPRGRLLFSGRIAAQKGITVAFEALELLPEARLTLVGPLDPGFAEAKNPPERVFVRPPVQRAELAGVYAEHDVLVFPVTWNEPWGLVPLEAMAVGLPVIATGTGGGAEYLEHERNCLLVAPGDARALAAAAERLLADGELRARLIRAGRETAERFSFERTAAEITSAAADLAAGREPTAGEALAPRPAAEAA